MGRLQKGQPRRGEFLVRRTVSTTEATQTAASCGDLIKSNPTHQSLNQNSPHCAQHFFKDGQWLIIFKMNPSVSPDLDFGGFFLSTGADHFLTITFTQLRRGKKQRSSYKSLECVMNLSLCWLFPPCFKEHESSGYLLLHLRTIIRTLFVPK